MNFSAVILAGGKSSRMGRDKAWLKVGGQTLLARQIEIAREIGAREILISGRPGVDYAEFDCRVVKDQWPDAGPLAGIAAALEATTATRLLVLAVDMPNMSAGCLQRLVASCTETTGAVPRVNGNIEPLAAVYPKAARVVIAELMDAHLILGMKRGVGQAFQPAGSPDFPVRCSERATGKSPAPADRNVRPTREVRGEGERSAKFPSAKSFAERCVTAGLARFVDLPAADAHCFTNWNTPADVAGRAGLCHVPA
jgi:molybdenum cofactor guanylyltransferase